MKKILLAATALAALSSPALSADLQPRTYTKAPVYAPPAPIYSWTGFYIGGHVGGAFNGSDSLGSDNARFIGGVQAGFDYQFATNWVLGIEGKYTFTDRSTYGATFPAGGFTVTDRNSDLGSVTGRLGYTWGPTLLYGKGGVGFRSANNVGVFDSTFGTPLAFTTSSHDTGYTVGAGLEYMFTRNWSGRVEYQYYNFGRTDVSVLAPPVGGPATISYHPDVHTFTVGLNYRFNLGGL